MQTQREKHWLVVLPALLCSRSWVCNQAGAQGTTGKHRRHGQRQEGTAPWSHNCREGITQTAFVYKVTAGDDGTFLLGRPPPAHTRSRSTRSLQGEDRNRKNGAARAGNKGQLSSFPRKRSSSARDDGGRRDDKVLVDTARRSWHHITPQQMGQSAAQQPQLPRFAGLAPESRSRRTRTPRGSTSAAQAPSPSR